MVKLQKPAKVWVSFAISVFWSMMMATIRITMIVVRRERGNVVVVRKKGIGDETKATMETTTYRV
jgi:hypothetical protein